jgi:hypothetical protein
MTRIMGRLERKGRFHYSSEMPKTMTVSAAEANRSFSKLLRAAEEGDGSHHHLAR